MSYSGLAAWLLILLPALAAAEPTHGQPLAVVPLGQVKGQPYRQYSTGDEYGREITFYLTEAPSDSASLPLVVYIQGSGCASLFMQRGDRIVPVSGHGSLCDAAAGRARVLIVEKPGVGFLDQPQNGCADNSVFNNEHTLERWAAALEAAVTAARGLPGVNRERLLVLGHSEGGVVAARVARDLPEIVTDVALLAGEGPSQLFSLIRLAREGVFFGRVSGDPEERVEYVLNEWSNIQADPLSTDKFFFGFAYRRWSSFLATSPLTELTSVKARIYLAQGSADNAVDPASADALYAHLISQGKQVTYNRVAGADHSFSIADQPEVDGWMQVLHHALSWFDQETAPPTLP